MDWHAWHRAYDSPDSRLRQRLRTVQERITLALDEAPPGPLRAVSVCAGQGRDLLGALLEQRGFDRVWLNSSEVRQGVGVHRFTGVPKPLVAGERMFTFIGYDALPGAGWTTP